MAPLTILLLKMPCSCSLLLAAAVAPARPVLLLAAAAARRCAAPHPDEPPPALVWIESPTTLTARARRGVTAALLPESPPGASAPPAPTAAQPPLPPALEQRARDLCALAGAAEAGFGLEPRHAERFLGMLTTVMQLRQRAAPANTLRQEESNMRHWRAVMDTYGLQRIRPSVHTLAARGTDAIELEEALWAVALLEIYARMQLQWLKRSRGRIYPPKASSALAALRGVRRVHVKRLGIETVRLVAAVQICEGLLREYAERHGPEALIPQRKEPFTRTIILALLDAEIMTEGKRLGNGHTIRRDSLYWLTIEALICFLSQSGFRKCAVALPAGVAFSLMHLSLANVVWYIPGASNALPEGWRRQAAASLVAAGCLLAAPTAAQFAMLAHGAFAVVRPPPDKADQLSLHWGADPIYLPYHPTEPINAARRLAEMEIRREVPAERRRHVPLFCDADGEPLRHGRLDALLRAMLLVFLPEAECRKYSWHSFRIYLACALLADGVDPATIQCMLRWRSEEALRIYARLNAERYGELLLRAVHADISSVRTTNAHRSIVVDADDQAAHLQRGLHVMRRDAYDEEHGREPPIPTEDEEGFYEVSPLDADPDAP